MNFLLRIVVIALLSSVAQIYFPWWSIILVALVVEMILGKGDSTKFFAGFYGIAIPWMVYAGYLDHANASILSDRVLQMFSLPPFGFVLVIITGLIGGIIGGVSSVVGGWIKQQL